MEQKEIKIKIGDNELKGVYANLMRVMHTKDYNPPTTLPSLALLGMSPWICVGPALYTLGIAYISESIWRGLKERLEITLNRA